MASQVWRRTGGRYGVRSTWWCTSSGRRGNHDVPGQDGCVVNTATQASLVNGVDEVGRERKKIEIIFIVYANAICSFLELKETH